MGKEEAEGQQQVQEEGSSIDEEGDQSQGVVDSGVEDPSPEAPKQGLQGSTPAKPQVPRPVVSSFSLFKNQNLISRFRHEDRQLQAAIAASFETRPQGKIAEVFTKKDTTSSKPSPKSTERPK